MNRKIIATELFKIAKELIEQEDWKQELKDLERKINNTKRILSNQAKRRGITENFGRDDLREIKDKFYTLLHVGEYRYKQKAVSLVKDFEEWCETYQGD